MSPSSKARRRSKPDSTSKTARQDNDSKELFVDPMLGAPLSIYIDSDVPDRNKLVELVKEHGGNVAGGYSSVPYILVDPTKESGQSLHLQYVGKKGKVVLDARWIHKCVEAGHLQSYQSNFAGCKVSGTERSTGSIDARRDAPVHVEATVTQEVPPPPVQVPSHPPDATPSDISNANTVSHVVPVQAAEQQDSLIQHSALVFNTPRPVVPPDPSNSWEHATSLTPAPSRNALYPPGPSVPPWSEPFDNIVDSQTQSYDFQYRSEDHWPANAPDFYTQPFDPETFHSSNQTYSPLPPASTSRLEEGEQERGRKRTRVKGTSQSVKKPRFMVSSNAEERSPTPPTRVLKSTHGGHHFTEEDVKYLSKYIEYCRKQGLPLSLREICERLAVKAPHHTFYSWRRYCNKHQIRLGGYEMEDPTPGLPGSPNGDDSPEEPSLSSHIQPSSDVMMDNDVEPLPTVSRNRSPSPPRMLFRSTTGKGVAFTPADVTFLIRYLEYCRAKDEEVNMVDFWKRVAEKAPHHSRASWMKYWRRHKHELEGSAPVTPRPDKKRKYDYNDDLLLARYFAKKPAGTSDAVFQAFARSYSHHPWKGWQEHHRIHKAKIDHMIHQILNGEMSQADLAGPTIDHS